ncbi:RDD family protein [Rhodanobacter sp. BL-MT-08]
MEVWIGRDGERHGPYSDGDIRQWLRSGQVSRDDLGWYEGLADWQPLSVLFPDEVTSTAPPSFAAPPVSSVLPSTTAATLEDYAGFWKRFAAWLLDYFVLLIPSGIILSYTNLADEVRKLLATAMSGQDTAAAVKEYAASVHSAEPALLAIVVIGFLYYALLEGSPWQATLGKLALGLRVTDLEGNRLSIGRSMARNVVRMFNAITAFIPLVCYIAVAWTSRKQGLHDLLAKALVLNGRAKDFKPKPATTSSNNSISA